MNSDVSCDSGNEVIGYCGFVFMILERGSQFPTKRNKNVYTVISVSFIGMNVEDRKLSTPRVWKLTL